MTRKVLMVVTNHGDIDGRPTTGIWLSEVAEPFAVLTQAGVEITVASPRGGPAPVDPRGYPSREEIAAVRDALAALNATEHLSSVTPDDFDGLFFPGGHGPMFDLANDAALKRRRASSKPGTTGRRSSPTSIETSSRKPGSSSGGPNSSRCWKPSAPRQRRSQ